MATNNDARRAWILRSLNEHRQARQEAEPGSKAETLQMKFEEAWVRQAEREGMRLEIDAEHGYREAIEQHEDQAA